MVRYTYLQLYLTKLISYECAIWYHNYDSPPNTTAVSVFFKSIGFYILYFNCLHFALLYSLCLLCTSHFFRRQSNQELVPLSTPFSNVFNFVFVLPPCERNSARESSLNLFEPTRTLNQTQATDTHSAILICLLLSLTL